MQLQCLGSDVNSPSEVEGGAQPKSNLVHFSIKIWHLVTTILIIFSELTDQIYCMQLK